MLELDVTGMTGSIWPPTSVCGFKAAARPTNSRVRRRRLSRRVRQRYFDEPILGSPCPGVSWPFDFSHSSNSLISCLCETAIF